MIRLNWTTSIRTIGIVFAAVLIGNASAAEPLAKPTPPEIGGIAIPQTKLSQLATAYVQQAEPDFLFNHSLRTYVFGAMRLKARGVAFNEELAYVAALFHDLGLVKAHATPAASFEVDGANAAEDFVRKNGGSEQDGRVVWNAIAMHDMGRAFQSHQTPEALLLGAGAGTDVDGPAPGTISSSILSQVLSAVPRLNFKRQFTAAAIDHCRRKPTSQIGWLDVLCWKVAPHADRGSVEEEIATAPFSE